MQDTIYIRDLHCRTIIGLNDWEREKPQDLHLNLEMTTSLAKAGESDNIDDTTNYRSICKQVINLVENSSFLLIEKLAAEIAKMVLKDFDIEKIAITIDKPAALRFTQSVAIRIERSREDFE